MSKNIYISASRPGLQLLLLKFLSEDTTISTLIKHKRRQRKIIVTHFLGIWPFQLSFFSKTSPPPLLRKTSVAWYINCCDIISLFLYFPVQYLVRGINCYHFYLKNSGMGDKTLKNPLSSPSLWLFFTTESSFLFFCIY